MIRILSVLIWLAGSTATTLHADTTAEAEIQSLIRAVADSGCEFSRNGSLHSAEAAAEHLELKYAQGKRYADSAEAFIEHLATRSSWSGEPYWMICNGNKDFAAHWLSARLALLRTP